MTQPCFDDRDVLRVPGPRTHLIVLPDVGPRGDTALAPPATPPVGPPLAPPPEVDRDRWAAAWAHRPLLLGLARARVEAHIAEDVVSEAMLRAATSEMADGALRAWLVTTTLRLCTDVHRRTVRDHRRDLRLASYEPTSTPAPDDRVIDGLHARWLAQQVDRLPERQARAVWLRAHGHDIGAIALTMALPYKTVESLLSRGRHTLRGWAGALLLFLGGWRVVAKRKAQFHMAAATLGAASDVTYDVARAATGLITRSF